MDKVRITLLSWTMAMAVMQTTAVQSANFTDVLDTPALMSPLAAKSLMQAVTVSGNRIIAVGQRGHIVISNDGGATWKQSPVPVSSDLTAVYFVDDKQGWAVGHDGVILHTGDGGDKWEVQLNGLAANDLLLAAMEKRVAAEPASEEAKKFLAEAQRYKEQGADKPFLDVWFADALNGYAVGAYNLIFKTADGGKSWQPWFDRTENPKFFNLYAIRPAAGSVYITGEGGLVLKLDQANQRFKAVSPQYNGSLFGVTEAKGAVLVYGLRGNVFRSEDGGAHWTKVDASLPATVVSATRTPQGTIILADVGGRLAASTDGAQTFTRMTLKNPMPLTAIADLGEGRLALTGPRGVAVSEALIAR
ncbi:MAG TPA: YCF48-related protein [Casimicrobiaceae bacterium]|nr:YCF48-related protein [Casimicrobiaceae bacterium]